MLFRSTFFYSILALAAAREYYSRFEVRDELDELLLDYLERRDGSHLAPAKQLLPGTGKCNAAKICVSNTQSQPCGSCDTPHQICVCSEIPSSNPAGPTTPEPGDSATANAAKKPKVQTARTKPVTPADLPPVPDSLKPTPPGQTVPLGKRIVVPGTCQRPWGQRTSDALDCSHRIGDSSRNAGCANSWPCANLGDACQCQVFELSGTKQQYKSWGPTPGGPSHKRTRKGVAEIEEANAAKRQKATRRSILELEEFLELYD